MMKSNSALFKRVFGIVASTLILFVFTPSILFAANYGDGNYGVDNYNEGDSTVPTGGSITYTDGYYISASVDLTVGDGTDAGSGINTSTRIVQRADAILSDGTCGSYGSFAAITPTGSYPSLTDATVASGNCYKYKYLVSDNSANQATYTSANVVKVDTGNPGTAGTPSTTSPTNSISQSWAWTAATDSISGIAGYLWRTTGDLISNGTTVVNNLITNLSEGIYTFFIKPFDNAGNEGTETSESIIVDTTLPTVPGVATATTLTTDTTPTWTWVASTDVSGTGIDYYSVQWCTDSGYSGCGANVATAASNSYTHVTTLSDGTWYFRVKAVDGVANESVYSSNGSIVINTQVEDTGSDEVIVTPPVDNDTNEIPKPPNTNTDGSTPEVPRLLTFIIKDENGNVIMNAVVTIDGQKYISDSKGQIYLESTPKMDTTVKIEYDGKEILGSFVGDSIVPAKKEETPIVKNEKNNLVLIISLVSLGLVLGTYLVIKKNSE